MVNQWVYHSVFLHSISLGDDVLFDLNAKCAVTISILISLECISASFSTGYLNVNGGVFKSA